MEQETLNAEREKRMIVSIKKEVKYIIKIFLLAK